MFNHHRMWQPANRGFVMTQERFMSDFDSEALSHALFAESPVDIGILHALPSLGFTSGPVSRVEKLAKLRDRYPGRFLLYGTVSTPVVEDAIKELRFQVENFGIDGLKLYPVFFYGGRSFGWTLAGADFAMPLLRAAHDMGIRNVAVHKALAIGPIRIESFKVADVEVPAAEFPDVNFQIVHAGLAFLEDTCLLLHRFKNVYANLEVPWNFSSTRPQLFAEIIGELLYWGSSQQILYGDGCNLVHPLPGIEGFDAFQMPDDLVSGRGYQILSDQDKALILGGNAARIHGIDLKSMLHEAENDRFTVARRGGLNAPWSSDVLAATADSRA
jgi:predicted TIM-barrel fold metal-dependent hydrolase